MINKKLLLLIVGVSILSLNLKAGDLYHKSLADLLERQSRGNDFDPHGPNGDQPKFPVQEEEDCRDPHDSSCDRPEIPVSSIYKNQSIYDLGWYKKLCGMNCSIASDALLERIVISAINKMCPVDSIEKNQIRVEGIQIDREDYDLFASVSVVSKLNDKVKINLYFELGDSFAPKAPELVGNTFVSKEKCE